MPIQQTDQRLFKGTTAEILAFVPPTFTGWTYAESTDDNTAYRWNSTTALWEPIGGGTGGSGPSGQDIVTADTAWANGVYADIVTDGVANPLEVIIAAPAAGFIEATFDASFLLHNGTAAPQRMFFRFTVNGAPVAPATDTGLQIFTFNAYGSVSMTARFAVAAGNHSVRVQVLISPIGSGELVRAFVTLAVPDQARVAMSAQFLST